MAIIVYKAGSAFTETTQNLRNAIDGSTYPRTNSCRLFVYIAYERPHTVRM